MCKDGWQYNLSFQQTHSNHNFHGNMGLCSNICKKREYLGLLDKEKIPSPSEDGEEHLNLFLFTFTYYFYSPFLFQECVVCTRYYTFFFGFAGFGFPSIVSSGYE